LHLKPPIYPPLEDSYKIQVAIDATPPKTPRCQAGNDNGFPDLSKGRGPQKTVTPLSSKPEVGT
jgi:hypothetical protein